MQNYKFNDSLHITGSMPDKFSKETRSKIMSSIRSKNTKPEITVRKLLWSHGKRYRVHDRSVFGTPDISSKKNRVAVFIDGCFWHGCDKCYKEPHTNTTYWRDKIHNNKKRRTFVIKQLRSEGWLVMEFWEHQINQDPGSIIQKIARNL